MPNQYTKVPLHLECKLPDDVAYLQKQFTKAVFKVLHKRLPQNPQLIDEIIDKINHDL